MEQEHLRAPDLPAPTKKRTGWPKGKPRGKKVATAKAAPVHQAESDDELFDGLSHNSCCFKCDENAYKNQHCCVITGWNMCGNPLTSGLQSQDRSNPKILAMYNRAIRWLKVKQAKNFR